LELLQSALEVLEATLLLGVATVGAALSVTLAWLEPDVLCSLGLRITVRLIVAIEEDEVAINGPIAIPRSRIQYRRSRSPIQ